jgi:hypothetical protein
MAKYSALDSNGRIQDFQRKYDCEAVYYAKSNHFQCLIKVRSFIKSSPIATLLPFKKEGY